MNEVVTKNNNLPELPKDIADFVLINEEKLVAVKAGIRALKKAGMAQEIISQKQEEASRLSEVVLDAQCRLGELLNEVPQAENNQYTKVAEYPMVRRQNTKQALKEELGITDKKAKQYSLLAKHKDIVEKAKAEAKANDDIVSRSLVLNMIKQEQKEEKRAERIERKDFSKVEVSPKNWKLYNIDIASLSKRDELIPSESVDAIITDPPYPKEFLPVFKELVILAERVLKPSGIMVVMCGQSYLPQVMHMLTDSQLLQYHWTACYLTEGGQSPSLWQKKVNTFWKPLIIITKGEYKGDYIGDVIKTDVNSNDKRFHHWGQSENGMSRIVERITDPGQVVLDPFVGGGTTGIVAVNMGRKFIGADVSKECIDTTETRLKNECM